MMAVRTLLFPLLSLTFVDVNEIRVRLERALDLISRYKYETMTKIAQLVV